ncbi:MAG: glycosyltransferase family 39 protein [Planctomycetota bacterium]
MAKAARRNWYVVAGFIFAFSIAWTTVCFLLDPTVPYDALESLNWANNGEFGSPKNPYMVGGVTAFGLLMEPLIPISLYWYLSHFVGVGIGMLGVWLLGKRLFGDNQIALLSLLSLNISGIINFDIIPYNDNYLLVTLWPYIFLCFIKAVYDHQKYWFALAIVSGLAAMSKYSSCVFLPFMLADTLVVREARK